MEINRQYVGARYVPKFYEGSNGTEWDENHIYEPLTIVTYLGNSYTSKKSVPATIGNPMNNPEYWAATGNYNAQVEAYRQDVVEVRNEIEEINEQLEVIGNTSAVYIGNSYVSGVGSTSGTDGLFELTKGLFDTAVKFGSGGAGFLPYSGHSTTYIDLLTQAGTSMSAEDREKVTHIIAVSACGDTRAFLASSSPSVGMFSDAFDSFNAVRENYFPNASIYVAFAEGVAEEGVSDAGISFLGEYAIHDIFRTASKYSNIKYLGWIGWEITHSAGMFSSDKYHPNDTGYKLLANAFKNAMAGCYEPSVKHDTITSLLGCTCTVTGTPDETDIVFGGWADAKTWSSNETIVDFTSAKVIPAWVTANSNYYIRNLIWDDNANIVPKKITFNMDGRYLKASSTITLTSGKTHEIASPLIIKHNWRNV